MNGQGPPVPVDDMDLPPEEVIFGGSEQMEFVRSQLETATRAAVPVLIGGQSGTGKEVIAKLIHRRSVWQSGAFVKVNCPAIPGTLLESELFGFERGAFTGAYALKPGRVETAEGGTLFLDEIAELEPSIQAKLLQLLQDGRFCRIGARQDRQVEVRVVCATNHDLAADVQAGVFRQDLYYRVNVLNIQLPSLNERIGDIPVLARYLVDKYSAKYGRAVPPLGKSALQMLAARPWLGNIRELENVIKRYVIAGSLKALVFPDGKKSNGNNGHGTRPGLVPLVGQEHDISLKSLLRHATKELERDIILRTLDANGWNRRLAARSLRISYTALLYKMREAGVPPTRGRRADHDSGNGGSRTARMAAKEASHETP